MIEINGCRIDLPSKLNPRLTVSMETRTRRPTRKCQEIRWVQTWSWRRKTQSWLRVRLTWVEVKSTPPSTINEEKVNWHKEKYKKTTLWAFLSTPATMTIKLQNSTSRKVSANSISNMSLNKKTSFSKSLQRCWEKRIAEITKNLVKCTWSQPENQLSFQKRIFSS